MPAARPYDLRHSFTSLRLWTYAHVIAEWEDRTSVDAEHEIRVARGLDVGRELDHEAGGDSA